MPSINWEVKLNVEGAYPLSLTKKTPLRIDSMQLYTLTVPAATRNTSRNNGKDKAPEKNPGRDSYSLPFGNVKFAAVYSGGQPNGLRVKLGKARMQALDQPLILMQSAAARLRSKTVTLAFENDGTTERSINILVGFDLPKAVRISAAGRRSRKRPRKAPR